MTAHRGDELPLFAWKEPVKVVPFPLHRRRTLVAKAARGMAIRGHELGARDPEITAEKILKNTLKVQSGVLERRGIAPATIAAELDQLETAIRAERVRLVALGLAGQSE
ncbi:DUF6074 family protein [Acuticoccus sediminis]|uniref:DUF6074 family protein n=1 Tax=Acuticoccus sediminis TaxID=2184697 RepID=UPI001CFDBF45|nr:DUF6074 family protein [Acuticoccus sediminis]